MVWYKQDAARFYRASSYWVGLWAGGGVYSVGEVSFWSVCFFLRVRIWEPHLFWKRFFVGCISTPHLIFGFFPKEWVVVQIHVRVFEIVKAFKLCSNYDQNMFFSNWGS